MDKVAIKKKFENVRTREDYDYYSYRIFAVSMAMLKNPSILGEGVKYLDDEQIAYAVSRFTTICTEALDECAIERGINIDGPSGFFSMSAKFED